MAISMMYVELLSLEIKFVVITLDFFIINFG